jgi:hypothetical protein
VTCPVTRRARSSLKGKHLEGKAAGDVGGRGITEVGGGVHQHDRGGANPAAGGVGYGSADGAGGRMWASAAVANKKRETNAMERR